jgi:hypothetical protein
MNFMTDQTQNPPETQCECVSKAELAYLRADKARLDFLEENQAGVTTNIAGLASGYHVLSQGKRTLSRAFTARSAIDAAMKATNWL